MDTVSKNDKLMKSLLFLSSLPIQLDDKSTWNELEQLQSNITISIQYHRMKYWVETHDYFQHQIHLQAEYKAKLQEYKAFLLQQQQEKKEKAQEKAKEAE